MERGDVHFSQGKEVTRVATKETDAVWTDASYTDTNEVITGFYLVEVADEDQARQIAALVPTGNRIEWRKVFPMGD